jgi:hypothetical protein
MMPFYARCPFYEFNLAQKKRLVTHKDHKPFLSKEDVLSYLKLPHKPYQTLECGYLTNL